MKDEKLSCLWWLVLIPCQCIVGLLFFRLGIRLDLMLFSNPAGEGHGIPFFSVIFFFIAAGISLIVFILAFAMVICGLRKKHSKD